jgi:hypothetical protein
MQNVKLGALNFTFCILHYLTSSPLQTKSISKIATLINVLEAGRSNIASLNVTAGFDGFVDQIVKIIKYKNEATPITFFQRKKEFADYIHEKEGTSFSLELHEQTIKLGGNMPIMANALATLGFKVNCIGALGYPHTHPVFNNLSANCKLFSFAEPGFSSAYEFQDGKMMMGHFGDLHTSGWEVIKKRIGLETIIDLYLQSNLFCFVNWSEIDISSDIWKGIIEEVLPKITSRQPLAFFDLSDCTKRSDGSVTEALQLIRSISQYARVIIGMNKNEARHICRLFNCKTAADDLYQSAYDIFTNLNPHLLVLHSAKEALAVDRNGSYQSDSFYIKDPLISTGAGDNFNAGFCTAQLLQPDPEASIIFANAVAGMYVKTGISPDMSDAIHFLNGYK